MPDGLKLLSLIDPLQGAIAGQPVLARTLSDLHGLFADQAAFQRSLQAGDPLVYATCGVEYPAEPGSLNYAAGRIEPGRIGAEYFMTKGHFHTWRAAAEVYLGLSGAGCMLLESEDGRQAQMIPLQPNHAIYVPGFTAHRTINTGQEPLVYLGIYPAEAGHDYGSIARQNFRHVVVEVEGSPTLLRREEYLAGL